MLPTHYLRLLDSFGVLVRNRAPVRERKKKKNSMLSSRTCFWNDKKNGMIRWRVVPESFFGKDPRWQVQLVPDNL